MAIDRNGTSGKKRFKNTDSDSFEITEDKARNILSDHFNKIRHSKDWIGSVALTITLFLTQVTSDFKEFLGLSCDVWKALFLFFLIASIIYTIYCIYNCIHNKDSVDDIIRDLENKR